MTDQEAIRGRRGHIWWVTASPTIWAVHLLVNYITAAIYCAKFSTEEATTQPIHGVVAVSTALAFALIAWIGGIGWRRHRSSPNSTPHDAPTRQDQVRMIGWATFLLSALSAVATLFTALVFVLAGSCH